MSAAIPSASFFSHFAAIEDPRLQRTQLHKLGDLLFIAVCATLCGANAFTAMEEFGHVPRLLGSKEVSRIAPMASLRTIYFSQRLHGY